MYGYLTSGSVDMKDFLLTMVAFRPDPPASDMNMDSGINKPNPILESEQCMSTMDDQCRLYFNVFDINETGYIDLEELKLVVSSLLQEGRPVSSETVENDENNDSKRRGSMGSEGGAAVYKTVPGMGNIEELFEIIDVDKSGQINYEEFQKFYDAVLTFSTQRSVM